MRVVVVLVMVVVVVVVIESMRTLINCARQRELVEDEDATAVGDSTSVVVPTLATLVSDSVTRSGANRHHASAAPRVGESWL